MTPAYEASNAVLPAAAPLLETRRLVVHRGARPVLHGIDLTLSKGEGLALIGPNAAGKSTLVRALAGALRPAQGGVFLNGRPLLDWPRAALARTIALVTAEDEAPPLLTVFDRVLLGRYPHRGPLRPERTRPTYDGRCSQCVNEATDLALCPG